LEAANRFFGFEIWVIRGSDKKKLQVSKTRLMRHVDLVCLLDKQHNKDNKRMGDIVEQLKLRLEI
jgi:hypothetical protein